MARGWTPENAFAEFETVIAEEKQQDAATVQSVGAPPCKMVASQSQIDPASAKCYKAKKYKCFMSGCKVRAWFGNVGELPNYCEAHL